MVLISQILVTLLHFNKPNSHYDKVMKAKMPKSIWAQESIIAYEISTHSVHATDNETKTDWTIRSIVSNVQSESKRKSMEGFVSYQPAKQ